MFFDRVKDGFSADVGTEVVTLGHKLIVEIVVLFLDLLELLGQMFDLDFFCVHLRKVWSKSNFTLQIS